MNAYYWIAAAVVTIFFLGSFVGHFITAFRTDEEQRDLDNRIGRMVAIPPEIKKRGRSIRPRLLLARTPDQTLTRR